MKRKIGLIGLSVMGSNLALNIYRNGYSIAVSNRNKDVLNDFVEKNKDKDIYAAYSYKDLIDNLESPVIIILMIKAGKAVDAVIDELLPHLPKGAIIVDGGNSYFEDSIRRTKELEEKGIHFVGAGISGGSKGALEGPSIMPSGDEYSKGYLDEILKTISAHVNGEPCSTWIGGPGSGHFVKTIHNGIEYADMQLIAETYGFLRECGFTNEEMIEIFDKFNKGVLNSYLIDITKKVLEKKDEFTNDHLVDKIEAVAGQKGTGKWTIFSALDYFESTPTIAEAVFMRNISAKVEERKKANKIYGSKTEFKKDPEIINKLEKALYFAKICSYAQGFSLIQTASKENNWNISLSNVALIWRGGCIIRADFLDDIYNSYKDSEQENMILTPYFSKILKENYEYIKEIVKLSIDMEFSMPAFSSALSYFNTFKTENLPLNLLQGQRDFFGAHTYKRIDREGTFTTIWE